MPPAPSPFRVVLLLARVSVRRWVNRVRSQMRRKKKAKPGEPRQATARKAGSGTAGLVFLGALFLLYGIFLSSQFMARLVTALERSVDDGRILLARGDFEVLRRGAMELDALPPGQVGSPREKARYDDQRDEVIRRTSHELIDRWMKTGTPGGSDQEFQRWMAAFRAKGLAAFREETRPRFAVWPNKSLWPEGVSAGAAVRAVGLLLLFLGFAQVLLAFGTGNADLGKVEWSLEWLFTLPASAASLFTAKAVEFSLVNPFIWLMTYPLLFTVLFSAGFGWWAAAVALGGTLAVAGFIGAIRLVGETWLRMTLPPNRLKNLQALCTLSGTILLFVVYWVVLAAETPSFFVRAAMAVPEIVLWNPLSVPALLCGHGAAVGAAATAAVGILFPIGAVLTAQRLVAGGLLATTSAYEGTRGRPTNREAATASPGRFRGIVGKELRLLSRDRNFMVQTLVVPILIVGFNLVMNPGLRRGLGGDPRHASTLAFCVGAYVLMFSGFHVLSVEGSTLWLLYTFPRDLHRILREKAGLWAALAGGYTLVVLAASVVMHPTFGWTALGAWGTALLGIWIYSFIASGLGALGTDPLEQEVKRKIRPDVMYLYMLLVSMYALAIYTPSVWGRLVQIILSGATAFGLWQKVRDRLPYLLDPTEAPPARVDVGDGLVAVLVFFVLQGLAQVVLTLAEAPAGSVMLLSFVIAGFVTAVGTLMTFRGKGVSNIFEAVGYRAEGASVGSATVTGFLAGGVAAGFAAGYLWALHHVEAMRKLFDVGAGSAVPAWMILLGVVAAPLFEEFLFRGLLFRGLRRSASPAVAVLMSAALFAIVHPPVSVLPVFVLGLATAIAFERTRLLWAPMVAHALYNAVVFSLQT